MRFYSFLILFSCIISTYAQPDIEFLTIATGFKSPVDIAATNDGTNRLFIVEKEGRIKIIDLHTNEVMSDNFLDIRSKVDDSEGEQGLLGLAFHPNFNNNGFFYVNYTYDPGAGLDRTRVARYKVSDGNINEADPNSEFIIIEIAQDFGNHNGGDLNFGPDGYLYIGMGDGGSFGDPNCRAQDTRRLLGKMLRIDVDGTPPPPPNNLCGLVQNYGIPSNNPYVENQIGCDEVWAIGLRNPWRFSFDSANGNMWIADVGQDNREEIILQFASSIGGENYGWKLMEGSTCYEPDPINAGCSPNVPECFDSDLRNPLFEYTHSEGCSVTGGYVYRGTQHPAMFSYYVFMDYCTNTLWALKGSTAGGVTFEKKNLSGYGNITTFGIDSRLEIYAASDGSNGTIYRLYDLNSVGVKPLDSQSEIKLYPNPIDNELVVDFADLKSSDNRSIEIFNQLGQIVVQKRELFKTQRQSIITVDHLERGIYFVKIKLDSQEYIKKIYKN